METVRWGIIGVGDVTEVKSGPGFQQADRSELVAVMRRSADKAADYARRHGVPRWYDDADALIADPEVDAVYIATPPDAHCEYTLRAAAAGKPVYVEKPMAVTLDQAVEMARTAKKTGKILTIGFQPRYDPNMVMVKQIVQSGQLGKIYYVETGGGRRRVREGDLPEGWGAFLEYRDRMIDERLEDNDVVHGVLATLSKPARPPLPVLNDSAWRVARVPITRAFSLATVGLLPPRLRERLGLRWTRAQEAELRAIGAASRASGPLLPQSLRCMGPPYLRWRGEAIGRGALGGTPAAPLASAAA